VSWLAPAFMRGRSAVALRERVSTLTTRCKAGNAKSHVFPWENRPEVN
jgi:hypothetical protein